ncbi:hypothetical protein [Nonomuraea jabiensis]|uniref:hypothetical protein n=1 Tax=Nonomuraea jabiensis TaxID=882448 RepID=UPI003D741B5D
MGPSKRSGFDISVIVPAEPLLGEAWRALLSAKSRPHTVLIDVTCERRPEIVNRLHGAVPDAGRVLPGGPHGRRGGAPAGHGCLGRL